MFSNGVQYRRSELLAYRKVVEFSDVPTSLHNLSLAGIETNPELFDTTSAFDRFEQRKKAKEERRENRRKRRDGEDEDKTNLASLVNYVAFSKNSAEAPEIPKGIPEPHNNVQANLEAQKVLRGAAELGRVDVAVDLYEQLVKDVDINAKTFSLMVSTCIKAGDLKTASEFLQKMETRNFPPDGDLLDQVMEMYSAQKAKEESSKLSSEAPVFVPQMSTEAPVFVPQHLRVDPQMELWNQVGEQTARVYRENGQNLVQIGGNDWGAADWADDPAKSINAWKEWTGETNWNSGANWWDEKPPAWGHSTEGKFVEECKENTPWNVHNQGQDVSIYQPREAPTDKQNILRNRIHAHGDNPQTERPNALKRWMRKD